MKQVTEQEFEQYIEEIIQGNKSRKKVIKELETDSRTLKANIQKLAETNPELYGRFIKKFPYKTKARTGINYKGLIIAMIKNGYTLEQASQIYEIGIRTISRRIKDLEEQEPDLIKLYRQVALNQKCAIPITKETMDQIEQLSLEEVVLTDPVEEREQKLLKIERQYNQRCGQFKTNAEAAESMGFTYNQIMKLLRELYAIEIEKNERKRNLEQKMQLVKTQEEQEH